MYIVYNDQISRISLKMTEFIHFWFLGSKIEPMEMRLVVEIAVDLKKKRNKLLYSVVLHWLLTTKYIQVGNCGYGVGRYCGG